MTTLTPVSPVSLTLTGLPTGDALAYNDGLYGADVYGGHAGRDSLTLTPVFAGSLSMVPA